MVQRKHMVLLLLGVLLSALFASSAFAADSATISFDTTFDPDQPVYNMTGTGLVDDSGFACDVITIVMTDATGQITDIDNNCIDVATGMTIDETDWGSYESLYIPTLGPITYSIYDTGATDDCASGENSFECGAFIASGAAECIAEAYFQPPGLLAGTPFPVCNFAPVPVVSAGCTLGIPSGAVVGEAPLGAQVYFQPNAESASSGVVLSAGTYIVLGQDESESFYKILLACQYVWVQKSAMQPSFLPPQNGAALPTTVVS